MADYMRSCPACHAFYTPNVAASIHKGTCPCGASLEKTNITVEAYGFMGDLAARKAFYGDCPATEKPKAAAPVEPAAPAVQYRKKPVPEEYNVNTERLSSAGCLAYFAWFGVLGAAVLLFYSSGLPSYLFGGFGLALFLYVFARLAADVSDVVRHLGAIRWLMEHGDETEPVPTAQPNSPKKKIDSGFWGVAAILLLVAALVAFYVFRNG
jgi:hypothetical protein